MSGQTAEIDNRMPETTTQEQSDERVPPSLMGLPPEIRILISERCDTESNLAMSKTSKTLQEDFLPSAYPIWSERGFQMMDSNSRSFRGNNLHRWSIIRRNVRHLNQSPDVRFPTTMGETNDDGLSRSLFEHFETLRQTCPSLQSYNLIRLRNTIAFPNCPESVVVAEKSSNGQTTLTWKHNTILSLSQAYLDEALSLGHRHSMAFVNKGRALEQMTHEMVQEYKPKSGLTWHCLDLGGPDPTIEDSYPAARNTGLLAKQMYFIRGVMPPNEDDKSSDILNLRGLDRLVVPCGNVAESLNELSRHKLKKDGMLYLKRMGPGVLPTTAYLDSDPDVRAAIQRCGVKTIKLQAEQADPSDGDSVMRPSQPPSEGDSIVGPSRPDPTPEVIYVLRHSRASTRRGGTRRVRGT